MTQSEKLQIIKITPVETKGVFTTHASNRPYWSLHRTTMPHKLVRLFNPIDPTAQCPVNSARDIQLRRTWQGFSQILPALNFSFATFQSASLSQIGIKRGQFIVSEGKWGIKMWMRKFCKGLCQLRYHTMTRFEIVTPHKSGDFIWPISLVNAKRNSFGGR